MFLLAGNTRVKGKQVYKKYTLEVMAAGGEVGTMVESANSLEKCLQTYYMHKNQT